MSDTPTPSGRFWDKPIATLTRDEWEALCDGCGQCCLHKLEDEDTGEVYHTNVACRLLDIKTARCADYRHRRAMVPDCLRLTPRLVEHVAWLPATCAYRLRGQGKPCPHGTISNVATARRSTAPGPRWRARRSAKSSPGRWKTMSSPMSNGTARPGHDRLAAPLRRQAAPRRRPPHAETAPKAPTVTIAGRALPVEIRRLAQARRMTLRLAPDGSAARVSMPTWARQADALAFVRERHDWLAAQLVRLPAPLALESGSALPFRGDSLILDWDRQHPRRPVVDDGRLLVGAPPSNWPCVPAAGSKPKHCACARQTLPTIARGRESRFPRSVFRVRRDAGEAARRMARFASTGA
jgi:uncharacterized cysteine cluster protein YcgN (CxxCxxCC family)